MLTCMAILLFLIVYFYKNIDLLKDKQKQKRDISPLIVVRNNGELFSEEDIVDDSFK